MRNGRYEKTLAQRIASVDTPAPSIMFEIKSVRATIQTTIVTAPVKVTVARNARRQFFSARRLIGRERPTAKSPDASAPIKAAGNRWVTVAEFAALPSIFSSPTDAANSSPGPRMRGISLFEIRSGKPTSFKGTLGFCILAPLYGTRPWPVLPNLHVSMITNKRLHGCAAFRISLLAHHWHSRLLLLIFPEELGRGGKHGPLVLVRPGGGLTRERAAREPERLVCSTHWNQAR